MIIMIIIIFYVLFWRRGGGGLELAGFVDLTVIVCWFLCSLVCITMALYAHVVSINYYYYY